MPTDVGSIFLEVFADTKTLKAQVKRAAEQAGKAYGREFDKNAAPGLSNIGNRISARMEDNGRMSGKEWLKGLDDEVRSTNISFDKALQRGVKSGKWSSVFREFVDESTTTEDVVKRLQDRMDQFAEDKGFKEALKKRGTSLESIKKQIKAYGDQLEKAGKQALEQQAAERLAADEAKAWAEQKRRLQKEADKQARESERKQKAADKEKRDRDREAAREAEKILRDQMKLQREADKEASKEARTKERLRLNQAMRESNALTKDLNHSFQDMDRTLRSNERSLRKLQSLSTDKRDIKKVQALNEEHERQARLIRDIRRDHDVAIARMVKGSDDYNRQIAQTNARLKEAGDGVDNFSKKRIRLKVDVDTPSKGALTLEGLKDGLAYQSAFNKATRGADADGNLFSRLSRSWRTFTTAFPAEVTIIMRGLLALGGPIATLGSGIAAIGTALAGSLTVGLTGLVAAAGGVFVGLAYGVTLATKSFEVFEDRFPKTQAALDNLRTSFEKVDLPTFAEEWSDSLAEFSNTLADSLRFDTVAENLGEATAAITDAFTTVLKGEPWAEFVDAIEGPISDSIANFGVGAAEGFEIALQFMTAAAPLAEHLGDQFADWTEHWNDFWKSDEGQRDMLHFMEQATEALDILFPLIANVGEALGNTLLIGSEAGNGMLGVLGDLAADWAEWTKSVEGETSLRQWFLAGREIFDALQPLIGGIAQMFDNMVTPASIRNLTGFMEGLGAFLPVLGEMFAVVEEVGLFAALGEALKGIGEALQPLMDPLKRVGAALGGVLMSAVRALTPLLVKLGNAIGKALDALAPWIEAFGQALEGLLEFDATKATAGFKKMEKAAGPALEGIAEMLSTVFVDILPEVINAFAEMVPKVLPALIDAVTALVEGLSNTLPTLVPIIVESIRSMSETLLNSAAQIIPQVAVLITEVGVALVQGLVLILPALLTGVVQIVSALVVALAGAMPQLAEAWATALPELASAMTDNIPAMVEGWTQMFISGVDAIVIALPAITAALEDMMPEIRLALEDLIPEMIDAGVALFIMLTESVSESAPEIAASLSTLLPYIATTLIQMSPLLIQMSIEFFLMMVEALPTIMPEITKAMEEISPAIRQAMETLAPVMVEAGKQMIAGLISGIWEMRPQWLKDIGSIVSSGIQKAKDVLGEKSPSKVFKEIGVNVVLGLVQGLDDGRDDAQRSVERLIEEVKKGVGNPNESALISYIKDVGKQLDGVWKHYDQVSEKLENANKDLKKQIDARADMVRSVRSSVVGELDLSSAIVKSRSGKILEGKTTAAGIGAVVAQMRAKARVFNQKMRWLISKGFSPEFVQMIAGYGMDEAIAIAKALQSGTSAERAQIKEDFAAFTNSATSVGNALAGQMFDAGINSTKALISGLVDEKAELKKAAQEIAKTLVDEIKRQLGIKSPSTVFMGIGENLMIGMNIGLTDGSKDVLNTVKSITDDVTAAFAPNVAAAAYGVNPSSGGGNGSVPATTTQAGTTVASGAIQIVTPVKDPAIVASMVLDGLVAKAI